MNFFGRKKPAGGAGAGGGGGGAKAGNTEPGAALQTVKERVTALEKRIEFLEKRVEQSLLDAKRYSLAKNKSAAMQALKRKKMVEAEINKLRVAVSNLEQQAFAIENASTTMDIVNGMRAGKQATESLLKQVNVDDVETLQDDIAEQMQIQEEMNNIISAPIGVDQTDDDELLAELDGLEGEEENELNGLEASVGATAAAAPSLPSAPKGKVQVASVPVEEDEDAKALRELEAEMAA